MKYGSRPTYPLYGMSIKALSTNIYIYIYSGGTRTASLGVPNSKVTTVN